MRPSAAGFPGTHDCPVFNFEAPGKAIAFAAGVPEILLTEAEKQPS